MVEKIADIPELFAFDHGVQHFPGVLEVEVFDGGDEFRQGTAYKQ